MDHQNRPLRQAIKRICPLQPSKVGRQETGEEKKKRNEYIAKAKRNSDLQETLAYDAKSQQSEGACRLLVTHETP